MPEDIVRLGLRLGRRKANPDAQLRKSRSPDATPDAGVPATLPEPAAAEPPNRDVSLLTSLIDRVLQVLARLAPLAAAAETEAFQVRLEEYRQIVLDSSRRFEVARVTEACVLACEQYLSLSRQYHDDRERELVDVIAILREAARLTLGDSSHFNQELLARSERFHGLVHLQDVGQIRQRIVEEVTALRRTVEEKQKRDERAHAQLVDRVESLNAKLSEVEEEVTRDPLTRIGNRRRFETVLARWLQTAADNGTPLSLAMVDVDNFKHINDTHGHPVGDRVLVATAQALTKGLRQTDFVARYGGEEFVVLLPHAGVDQVEGRMQELLRTLASSPYDYDILGKKQRIHFTASCGLTEWLPGESDEDFIKRADEALYTAKRRGKNRVVIQKPEAMINLLSWG